jgi:hypothetical protein
MATFQRGIMMRSCVLCAHFCLRSGSPGYSEWTPGCDMTMKCYLGKWALDPNNDDIDDFRAKLAKAKGCQHYKYHKHR